MDKPILCLDFDGVCHSYTSGWKGANIIEDPPVEGLFEFLEEARQHFTIVIFSSRSSQIGGLGAMKVWFEEHYTEYLFRTQPKLKEKYSGFFEIKWLIFAETKPPAHVTIDDRAITFEGTWPNIEFLKAFKPWNRK